MAKRESRERVKAAVEEFTKHFGTRGLSGEDSPDRREYARQLAYLHKIPYATLRHRIWRRDTAPLTRRTTAIMSELTEQLLLGLLTGVSAHGRDVSSVDVRMYGERLLQQLGQTNVHLNRQWAHRFLKRHKQHLHKAAMKPSNSARHHIGIIDSLTDWSRQMENILDEFSVKGAICIHLDETRLMPNAGDNTKILPKDYNNVVATNDASTDCWSLLRVVMADGTNLLSVYIFKDGRDEEGAVKISLKKPSCRPRRFQNQSDVFYCRNKSGFMCTELYVLVLERLVEILDQRDLRGVDHDLPVFIWADGTSIHKPLDTIRQLFDMNIHCLYFPSPTSHVVHPLDDERFAILKNKLKVILGSLTLQQFISSDNVEIDVVAILRDMESEVSTRIVIITSFKTRGIMPFDAAKIAEHVARHAPVESPFEGDPFLEQAHRTHEIVTDVLRTRRKDKSTQKGIIPDKNTLYTSDCLIQYADEKLAEAAAKQAEHVRRAAEKAQRRRMRAERKRMSAENAARKSREKEERAVARAAKKAKKAEKTLSKDPKSSNPTRIPMPTSIFAIVAVPDSSNATLITLADTVVRKRKTHKRSECVASPPPKHPAVLVCVVCNGALTPNHTIVICSHCTGWLAHDSCDFSLRVERFECGCAMSRRV